MSLAQTVLYDVHVGMDAKMAGFAGWNMPLWYPAGHIAEHMACRRQAALFDICHMGEIFLLGRDALPLLRKVMTNNVDKIADGQAQYNYMLNETGGVIDDCIVYRFQEDEFMVVVNGGTIQTDFDWLSSHATAHVDVVNRSPEFGKLDLQGPLAPKLLAEAAPELDVSKLKFFRFQKHAVVHGIDCLVSRTGYTGEVGFEIYVHTDRVKQLWDALLSQGQPKGLLPAGLGARDSLRVEAGLPLHGSELLPDSLFPADYWDFALKSPHSPFGLDKVMDASSRGGRPHVYAFVIDGRRKAMPGFDVYAPSSNGDGGEKVGTVVSGTMSPILDNKPIGFLRATSTLRLDGDLTFKDPARGTELNGSTTAIPFVELTSRRPMADFLD